VGTGDHRIDEPDDRTLFLVARGSLDLLGELREFLEDLGWIKVVEDRRSEPTLLPREGREGKLYVAY
jgi:hypothetical protein